MLRAHVISGCKCAQVKVARPPVSVYSSSRHAPGLAAVWVLIFQVGKNVSIRVAGLHPQREQRPAHESEVLFQWGAYEGQMAAGTQMRVADAARQPDHGIVAREALRI